MKYLLVLLIFLMIGCTNDSRVEFKYVGCSVHKLNDSSTISCPDGSQTIVYDGTPTILEIIDPCGDDDGYLDEIIIKLTDGQLLWYNHDKYKFIGLLEPGIYETSDHQKCVFAVTNNYDVIF
jgi:hypothetical protein